MSKCEVNMVFGRLTVLEKLPNYYAKCKCECGTEKIIYRGNLVSNRTISCGCRWKETVAYSGLPTNTPTHNTWENMINRCNTKSVQHKNSINSYKGVIVCDEWLGANGFRVFFNDMGLRPEGKTLDRIDNERGYFKANCRWATKKEQQNNTRCCRKILFRGSITSISDIMVMTKLPYMKVWHGMV